MLQRVGALDTLVGALAGLLVGRLVVAAGLQHWKMFLQPLNNDVPPDLTV